MAFIRLPLGLRVGVEYEAFGKIVANIYHVTTTDPITTIKLFDIATVFETWWEFEMKENFSTEIALASISVQDLNVPNGEKVIAPVVPNIPGTDVGVAVTNNVALVVTLNTAKTGRSFRGRSYLAGLPRTKVIGNVIETATAAAILTDMVSLESLLSVQNANLVVASFQSAGIPRAEGIATVVESFAVTTRVDTQRRRLPQE